MIVVRSSITVARPPEAVFDFLADVRNEARWLPGTSAVSLLTAEPVALGSRFRGRYSRAGLVTVELVAFDRPRALTLRARSSILDFDDSVTLAPLDASSTRLDATMSAEPRGVMRLVAFAMRRALATQFDASWRLFKAAVESR